MKWATLLLTLAITRSLIEGKEKRLRNDTPGSAMPAQTQQPASVDQMLNAGYKLCDWLNFYWNFYVVFVGVVLGWIFSARAPWEITQQIVVTVFYMGFTGISLCALFRTYCALNETSSHLRAAWGRDSFKDALWSKISQPLWEVTLVMHVLADLGVIFCIWRSEILKALGVAT